MKMNNNRYPFVYDEHGVLISIFGMRGGEARDYLKRYNLDFVMVGYTCYIPDFPKLGEETRFFINPNNRKIENRIDEKTYQELDL